MSSLRLNETMTTDVKRCHLCRQEGVAPLLDFGMQPICNRYLADQTDQEFKHPLAIGQCPSCGLIQISRPFPAAQLRPVYDWITYVEPEDHLDRLAQILMGLPGITPESIFCGMTFKDDSLLKRMKGLGIRQIWRIDPREDLGIRESGAGVETVQDRFGPEVARRIVQGRGRVDGVVARHILEHAHRLERFAEGLRELVKPDGWIVIELPDCSRSLEAGDCTTVWEEHIFYFTEETFRRSFSFCGFSLVRFERFGYPQEDSLVGIARLQERQTPQFPSQEVLREEKDRADLFVKSVVAHRDRFKRVIFEQRSRGGKVALLGAGHLGCAFINLLGLKDDIDFVVDNDPHKKGLWMPGSRLPIYDSHVLLEKKVGLCLLGVNPANQAKVVLKHQAFLEQGGSFLSIFPGGPAEPVWESSLRKAQIPCP